LRNSVIDKLEHADITALPEVKKELLTFTVIGGGFSGVETAGEMMELIERSLVFYPNIDRSEVRVLSSSPPTASSASCRRLLASTPGASSRTAASRCCSGPASARRPAQRSSPPAAR